MIDIYGIFRKLPGGALLFPMFTVALINTLFPNLLESFGGMTTATYKTGALTIAGMILFATGADIDVKTIGTVIRRCGVLTMVKCGISFGFGFLFVFLFGREGIFGISAVAFVTCICSTNPGVFMGLITDYGEAADMGNFAVMSVLTMPCFPVLILTTATGSEFDIMNVVTVLVPFLLGLLLGNLDPAFGKKMASASPVLMPFLGACFGSSINLVSAFRAGLGGVILALAFLVLHVPFMVLADRVVGRRPGYCGAAWCSVAGIAMTVPVMLAGDAAFAEYLAAAGAQIALAIVITNLGTPLITRWIVGKWGSPGVPAKKDRKAESRA